MLFNFLNVYVVLLTVFNLRLSQAWEFEVSPFTADLNCRLICSSDDAGDLTSPGKQEQPADKGISTTTQLKAKDCSDKLTRNNDYGFKRYTVYPFSNNTGLKVLCDQSTDGGGWTVIQRRVDNSVNFYRNWTEYQRGFGNLDTNFWLGLDNIRALLKSGPHEIRFDMVDFKKEPRYAHYSHFYVGTSSVNYVLTISGYSGNAGDALSEHNGRQFSTFDADHDTDTAKSCAKLYKGGWWYAGCYAANPNGLYLGGSRNSYANGISWKPWLGIYISLKRFEIKIRKTRN